MRPSVFRPLRLPTNVRGTLVAGPALRAGRSLTALYGAQGVAALAGLGYGKGIATFVEPVQFGTYSVQMAVMTLGYSGLVTPLVQSFTASVRQRADPTAVSFHGNLFARLFALVGLAVAGAVGLGELPAVAGLIWLGALAQGLYALGTGYLNVAFQHRRYAVLQAFPPVLTLLLLGVVVIGGPDGQVTGLWLIFGMSYGASALLAMYWAFPLRTDTGWFSRWTQLTRQLDQWRSYVAYASPLLVYAGFGWVINYADRYLMAYWLPPADLGFYATGYSLGARMAILSTPLIALLTPKVFALQRAGEPAAAAHPVIRQHLGVFAGVALPVCALSWAFHDVIGRLLLSDAYWPAFRVVPVIALAYTFSLGIQFLETKFYAFRQTRYILWHSVVGALTNILLNLWLIPRLGLLGAAWAMVGSCGCQFAVAAALFVHRPNRAATQQLTFKPASQ